jgi:hypothetical protein
VARALAAHIALRSSVSSSAGTVTLLTRLPSIFPRLTSKPSELRRSVSTPDLSHASSLSVNSVTLITSYVGIIPRSGAVYTARLGLSEIFTLFYIVIITKNTWRNLCKRMNYRFFRNSSEKTIDKIKK